MRVGLILAILGLGLGACGGAPAPPIPSRAAEQPALARRPVITTFALNDDDIQHIAKDVAIARQLSADRPIAISRLTHDQFIARFRATKGAADPGREAREAAFVTAFDFAPKDTAANAPTKTEVEEEELRGFYDVKEDKVFVPDMKPADKDKLFESSAVIAHEVEHALQAQHFGKLPAPKSSDQAIAHLALIEGDAQAAMGAYMGFDAGAPVGRTLRRLGEATKRVPIAAIAHGTETHGVDRALARTRERLEFPYNDGMLFVSDLYRAGGFDAVDAAFKDPPTSTEQILHPEKYLAGEEPREIAPLDVATLRGALPNADIALSDTLGELDMRILLGRCLDKSTAKSAAEGWGGDRFTIVATPDHRLMTAWVSAWDSETDAREFEDALTHSDACWGENVASAGGQAFAIGSDHTVQRKGDVVVFMRGVPDSLRASLARQLYSSVGPAVKPKPRSGATLPPRVPLPEPEMGRMRGDVYENTWLGVVGRVPPGMTSEVGKDELALTIKRSGVLVYGSVATSTRVANDEQNERSFREIELALSDEVSTKGRSLASLGGGAVDTVLGRGVEHAWAVTGTAGGLRVVLVPICAGSGSIVFVEAYGDPYARQVLDAWMGSFRFTSGRNLKACDYLDPK